MSDAPLVHGFAINPEGGSDIVVEGNLRFVSEPDFLAYKAWAEVALSAAEARGRAAGQWQTMDSAPKNRTAVILAVPSLHAGHPMIVGEAYFDPEHENGGAWWWAGTGYDDYHASPIRDTNAEPALWQEMPAPPEHPAIAEPGIVLRGLTVEEATARAEALADAKRREREARTSALDVADRTEGGR
jgi:hypothetical protein